MVNVKSPVTLSDHFDIDPAKLCDLGVLNPTLEVDTQLFIDPLLFQDSTQPEIHTLAVAQYRERFERVIENLALSKNRFDRGCVEARKRLVFHEIRGTCLGYGGASIYGSGFGPKLSNRLFALGKEIVDLGIQDPDLFLAMALLEEGIGPDRISDMATNVIFGSLIAFNSRILNILGLKGKDFRIARTNGIFLRNPCQSEPTPIILVPSDILRKLPIVCDWNEIALAAQRNKALRKKVNRHIGSIWETKVKNDEEFRAKILASRDAFQTLLDVVHEVAPKSYNVDNDPDLLINWSPLARTYSSKFPLDLSAAKNPSDLDALFSLVLIVLNQFKKLIEQNGLNKELYTEDGSSRNESAVKRLFFAIAYNYCKTSNADVLPEADAVSGKVYFKLPKGFEVLVDVKLSSNPRLVQGYSQQLQVCAKVQQSTRAVYVVIDVGRMGEKAQSLKELQNRASSNDVPLSPLKFINGVLKIQ